MFRGLILGILLGILLVFVGIYFYFSTGRAPVATSAQPMPFERKFANMGLDAYLAKLPHPEPQVPADEANFLAGAQVYKQNCAVCHGLPGQPRSNIAEGMAPRPPQLFKGTGVTDDEAWETYWKAENGIRMTGMPGFKSRLNETQIWQVTVMLKNADKISAAVKAALLSNEAPPLAPAPVASNPANPATRH
ncbi:MAG TPA: cytochrome c [Candidatus Acidoferrum sp.]|jgi:mono/diheme cytochrome c family protein